VKLLLLPLAKLETTSKTFLEHSKTRTTIFRFSSSHSRQREPAKMPLR